MFIDEGYQKDVWFQDMSNDPNEGSPKETDFRDIPSEKIGQNIHPPESCILVINYQHWTGTSAFRPFLAPRDYWGGLGGQGGGVVGPADPKNDIIAQRPLFALECMALGCNN